MSTAAGTFGTAWLTARTGEPTQAIGYVGLLYIPTLVACLFLPEPPRKYARGRWIRVGFSDLFPRALRSRWAKEGGLSADSRHPNTD